MRISQLTTGLLMALMLSPAVAEPTADEIVQRCDLDTYPGTDQRSTLTVILRDPSDNDQRTVYKRYWIDAGGKDQIVDKMLLFTEFPPDASGTAFMRWGYLPAAGKNADQWLFLPAINSLRRVSVRDPGDSFLNSQLTYRDVSYRALEADEHRLLGQQMLDGRNHYVVESVPRESNPLYSKVITWYMVADEWADCVKRGVEYYDPRGGLLKTQTLTWQQIGDAWLWDEVVVENVRNGHASIFRVTDAEVNVGLDDRLFSERTMRRGVR